MIRIAIVDAGQETRSFQFDGGLIRIGRDAANDVVLRNAYVSSRHGEIRAADGLVAYQDLMTTNGTLLRRGGRLMPLESQGTRRMLLESGDELLLGEARQPVVLRVLIDASVVRPAAPPSPPRLASTELDATGAEMVGEMPARLDRDALLALHRFASRLSAHLELEGLLPAFVAGLLEAFRKASHVSVFLLSEDGTEYVPAIASSRQGDTAVRPLSRHVRDTVLARGMALAFREGDEVVEPSQSLHSFAVRTGLCAPLWDGRKVVGIVQVDCRGTAASPFDGRDLEVLVVFAHQAAMAIENARLHAGLRRTCEQSIRGLVRALEAKDEYTSGHSEAVAELCALVAHRMGLGQQDRETIRRAALLHDIGKIGIPFDVLNKKERLTPAEFDVLRTHPELGARILEPFGFLSELVPIVLHHHERWDGRGYPAGLSGEGIPLGARVLAVVDTYHALVSDRAYRIGVGVEVAVAELRRHAGTQFDPSIVGVLAEVVGAGVDTAVHDAEPVGSAR